MCSRQSCRTSASCDRSRATKAWRSCSRRARSPQGATVRNRYPLPRVDELFDQLQGARYFSKIDLRTGCWQIRMAAEAVERTAFTSRHGHYEWLVLPMGLTNAPAEFMALMETTFREELNKFILVFLDDILIYSKTLQEHEEHLR